MAIITKQTIKLVFYSGLLLSVIGLLSGCKPKNEAPVPSPRTVEVIPIKLGDQLNQYSSGRLQAAEQADLSFEISGKIRTLDLALGQRVKKGQKVARLDAQAHELNVEMEKSNLQAAQTEFNDASRQYQRLAALFAQKLISASAVDEAEARLERATAQVSRHQASLAKAQHQLAKTFLYAPFSGLITKQQVEQSEVVMAGQPIAALVNPQSQVEVKAWVPSRIHDQLSMGDTATVSLSLIEQSVRAKVTQIGIEANQLGLFPVIAQLIKPPASFLPGMSVSVKWQLPNIHSRPVVPLTAIELIDKHRARVFVVEPAYANRTRLKARIIKVGALRETEVEVVSGLAGDEWIVAKGVNLLREHQEVYTSGAHLARYNH
ncbi:efflux RND transporter periplasmic adaptor subunit [Salinivibrio kushneri]|uniref:Efflux RND transporter periplasmic adaptor subunit n=1 Tax=Salinivibrio kushneri TaxID=1908198 RepID=A0AA47KN68_9GAMM|nr:efflux RND transporter periplasmic adaptor subunit [Salinivibrio kushneri]WBA09863.1 efflux RND transporter periplasmic adaptor subunit [Salinivibrio kushneri]